MYKFRAPANRGVCICTVVPSVEIPSMELAVYPLLAPAGLVPRFWGKICASLIKFRFVTYS